MTHRNELTTDHDVGGTPGPTPQELSPLARALATTRPSVLSSDLFDTVLLRDHTTETDRFARAGRRAAPLLGVDPAVLARLRWSSHDAAYRAITMAGSDGEAALSAICRSMATSLGRDDDAAALLRSAEVETDIEHLRPNRPLLALYARLAGEGVRVVAVSDTYYSEADLRRILDAVVGPHPFTAVYSSADIGLTKHRGHLFDEVAKRENLSADQILHVGDHPEADVRRARAAGWAAVHLPRDGRHRLGKHAGRLLSIGARLRRMR